MVTYKVGSDRESLGKSGFAHFFEHMMFQGSLHVKDEEHFKIVQGAGGQMNGTTNRDRTNYFETVPSNQVEKMLWLEADRMGFLLDSVTQKKFEVQRATVKNERGQRYDNAPYGLVFEKIGEALYPKGHPYSWSTIGYLVDLDRVDVNDLKRFYMRWYGPNNAVLTVAGDVNTEDVLIMAQKYFGSINVGKDVNLQTVSPVVLSENRYLSYEDNIKFPQINVVYPTDKANTKDDAALEILSI
jgi:zinc protease